MSSAATLTVGPDPTLVRLLPERITTKAQWADVAIDARMHATRSRTPTRDAYSVITNASSRQYQRIPVPDGVGWLQFESWTAWGNATLWLFTFPDGHRLGVLPQGQSDREPDHKRERVIEPLDRATRPHYYLPVSDEARARAVRDAAYALRQALADPLGWFEGYQYGSGACRYISEPWMLLVEYACYGFISFAAADDFEERRGTLSPLATLTEFADAGFDVNDLAQTDWFRESEMSDGWHLTFTSTEPAAARLPRWGHLRSLYEAGWSLPAVEHLHYKVVDLTPGYHHTTPAAWAAVPNGADAWVKVAGSPRVASLCIEAGLPLVEAREVAATIGLDESALRMLIALQTRVP